MKIPTLCLSFSELPVQGRKITLEKKTNTSFMKALKFKIPPLPSTPPRSMSIDSHFLSTDLAPIKNTSACHPQCTQTPGYQMNSQASLGRICPGEGKKEAGRKINWMSVPSSVVVSPVVAACGDILRHCSGLYVEMGLYLFFILSRTQPCHARVLEPFHYNSTPCSGSLSLQSLWSSLLRDDTPSYSHLPAKLFYSPVWVLNNTPILSYVKRGYLNNPHR